MNASLGQLTPSSLAIGPLLSLARGRRPHKSSRRPVREAPEPELRLTVWLMISGVLQRSSPIQ